MKKTVLFCLILLFAISFAAFGQDEVTPHADEEEARYTIIKDTIGLRVDSEGRMTQIEDEIIKLHNKGAIDKFNPIVRVYNASRQELDVVIARTIQPDGRSIQVSSTSIGDRDFPNLTKDDLYKNTRVKTVTFPELKAGSTIVYRIETKCKQPYPLKAFWETSFTQDFGDIEETSFFVEFPRDRMVYYSTAGYGSQIKPAESLSGDRKTYSWQFKKVKGLPQEVAMPPLQELATRIMVSSSSSWDEVGALFNELIRSHLELNEAMKEKLRSVVGDAKGEEIIKKIIIWLCREKDIVNLNLGAGGYDFNDVSSVFGAKAISSKDFALLLYALFKAENIEVYPAIISSYSLGKVYKEIPSIQQFDTILLLVKVDGKTIWIEPQDNDSEPGELSSEMQARTALVIKDGHCELIETPQSEAYVNREEIKGEIKLNDDGSIDGAIGMRESGIHKIQWLRIYSSIQERERQGLAKILLGHRDPRALLIDFSFRDNKYEKMPFYFTSHFRINDYVKKSSDSWIMNLPMLGGIGLKDLLTINPSERVWPISVGSPFQEDWGIHLILPEKFSIKGIPRDKLIDNDVGSFQVVCNFSGREIQYHSKLVIRKGTISQKDAMSLINILQTLDQAHREVITLEEKKN